MNREKALSIVKGQMTERRYIHTIGVMETAIKLAHIHGADENKAEIAAIFHDYAKFRPKDEMKQIIITQQLQQDLLQHDKELWHAPVGAYLVENEVGIKDLVILNAIKYHTSGNVGMTILDKIIYVADYIEPGRVFPGVDEVREVAETNLDLAVILTLRNTISFLMQKKQVIYPDTFFTYNELIREYKAERK
ncbi:bis(5'-nucleosyl)-tetraphosphatase (symmetrical) YqeK [Bacillus sp. DJP31]|uniref:bis(5'-nucleosyl)-tetraphosphatase (symmetrical) YqeK n=1 Tax=Bacillus sp. DJP31 TaxID=3409789 RepID=UPI003BB4C59C